MSFVNLLQNSTYLQITYNTDITSACVSIMELTKFNTHGFYFGLEHKYNIYIENWFKENMIKYNVEEYAITWEIASDGTHLLTAGQHFHVVIYSTTANCIIKTSDNIKKKLKLHLEQKLDIKFLGKSGQGNARQYGVASKDKLKNPTNYLIYCLKDKNELNFITPKLNELAKTLPEWKEQPKEDKMEWFYELQKLLQETSLNFKEHDKAHVWQADDNIFRTTLDTFRLKVATEIIKIYKKKCMKPPTRSQMDAFVKYHMLNHQSIPTGQFIDMWYYRS